MRIVIDLDGTICPIKQEGESYADLKPYPQACEKIKELRAGGHYIIIQTARNMATCQSNLGRVVKNIGKITLDWLEQHQIEFDEIYFGKPNAHLYIDDRALRFEGWDGIVQSKLQQLAKDK
ncbi:MAG: HAD hydrolase family protein [Cyclobacteriaceae bacterium]|nr:HAD hydrolase family protein [Cyclobacteriaceae bacterium]